MKKRKLIFDLETNGFAPSLSVLSFSALVVDENNEIIKEFDRYYERRAGEELNPDAVQVNGLTDEVIRIKRVGVEYPRYFSDDKEIFELFSQEHELYIAHNIEFDKSFMEYHHQFFMEESRAFCTMKATQCSS